MNGKQILYKGLSLIGMERFYKKVHLTEDNIYSLEFYESRPNDDTLICQIIRGLLFDQIPELYQALK
jgi:hypothetical protein